MNKVTFDLDVGSIDGVVIGSSEKDCQSKCNLNNPVEGYSINLHEGEVSSLFTCFLSGYNGFQCFSGYLKINNDLFDLNSSTTISEIKSKLGKPTNEWSDGVESCLEYLRDGLFVEVVWNIENEEVLQYISVEKG